MRALALAALVVLASLPLAAGGDPPGPTCGLTVCAEARSTVTVTCTDATEGAEVVARCAFRFVSWTWGHSPSFLSGRVFTSGDAILHWTCTAGCDETYLEQNVNAAATWLGGPVQGFPLHDSGFEDGGDVLILFRVAELRVPAGQAACLDFDVSLETTALAESPHAPPPVPGGWIEEVYDGAGAVFAGQHCLP
jgi:hypothetical protein